MNPYASLIHPSHYPSAPNASVSRKCLETARDRLRRAAMAERWRETAEADRLRGEAVAWLREAARLAPRLRREALA